MKQLDLLFGVVVIAAAFGAFLGSVLAAVSGNWWLVVALTPCLVVFGVVWYGGVAGPDG